MRLFCGERCHFLNNGSLQKRKEYIENMRITKRQLQEMVQQEAHRLREARGMGRGLTPNRKLRAGDELEDDAHAVTLELGAANGRMGAALSRLRSMLDRSSGQTRKDITEAASELQQAIDSLHSAMELAEALDYA